MSCDVCERIQQGKLDQGRAFVRADRANVELVGCDEHLGKLIGQLRGFHQLKDLTRQLCKRVNEAYEVIEMYRSKCGVEDQLGKLEPIKVNLEDQASQVVRVKI